MDMTFTKLMVDTAHGVNAENYSAADSTEAIRNRFREVLGVAADCSRKEMHRAIRRHKQDIYEVIEDTIEDLRVSGWNDNPFFNEYVEQKNIALGDVNDFYVEDDSLLTISKFSGNHHDLIRQKLGAGESFTVKTSWYGVKIYTDFELMMLGKIDWAAFIQKIYKSWDNFVNGMIYEAFMDVEKVLPPEFVKTGTITAENVEALASLVSEQAGGECVIMGTKTALSKLYKVCDVDWISEDMKKERNTTGLIGHVNGVRLVAIPQVYEAGTRKALIDNKKLLFMPVRPDFKPIKFINEGDAYFNEVADRETNVDMTIEAEYMAKIGVGVVMNLNFGMYKEIA